MEETDGLRVATCDESDAIRPQLRPLGGTPIWMASSGNRASSPSGAGVGVVTWCSGRGVGPVLTFAAQTRAPANTGSSPCEYWIRGRVDKEETLKVEAVSYLVQSDVDRSIRWTVEKRGQGYLWSVMDGPEALHRDGTHVQTEPAPSDRERPEWRDQFQMPFAEALELAKAKVSQEEARRGR